jgi:hypothetical protein
MAMERNCDKKKENENFVSKFAKQLFLNWELRVGLSFSAIFAGNVLIKVGKNSNYSLGLII